MSLKKNVIANYIGQGWSAIMSFIFIPVYIKYLGMEAYGLIGLFTLLQLTLSIVDSAITPAINREMSRFTGNERTLESTRNLLRTTEIFGISFCSIFALIVLICSSYIADYWLKAEVLSKEMIIEAVAIAGFVVAMRCMEGIYRSVLIGLQKQIGLNWILVITSTLRNVGVIYALKFFAPTIKVFFYWQGVLSLFTVISQSIYVYTLLPGMFKEARFSIDEMKSNWSFALGSVCNSALNFLCTQSDKIILSKFLLLQDFGNYSFGVNIVQVITVLITPLPQAFYPNIVRLKSLNDDEEAANNFHLCCQLINIVSGVAVSILIFFGHIIIGFWTKDITIANNVTPIVQILAVGSYLFQLGVLPYHLPYTAGMPKINIKAHLLTIILIFAVSLPLIIYYGVNGAIWGNVIQNFGLFICFPLFFSCYLKKEQNYWIKNDLIIPTVVLFLSAYLTKRFIPVYTYDYVGFIQCCFIAFYILIISSISCKNLRTYLSKKVL